MFSRIRSFLSRHRRKFFVTGIVVGGAFLLSRYVRKALRDWQEKETRELLDRTRKQQHYESVERTCNLTAITLIPAMKESISKIFNTEAIVDKLKEGNGNKLDLWEELKFLAFAKVTLMVYISSILIITLRLQLNLIGGYMFKASMSESSKDLSKELNEKYLTLSKYLLEDGARRMSLLIQEKVTLVLKSRSLKEKLRIQDLEQIFWSIHSAVSSDSHNPCTELPKFIIPDFIACDLPTEQSEAYEKIISETRDLLESEEIQTLISSSIRRGFSNFVDKLGEYFIDRTGNLGTDAGTLMTASSSKHDTFFSSNIPQEQPGNALFHHLSIPMAKVIPIVNGLMSARESTSDVPFTCVQQLILMDDLKVLGANVYEGFSA